MKRRLMERLKAKRLKEVVVKEAADSTIDVVAVEVKAVRGAVAMVSSEDVVAAAEVEEVVEEVATLIIKRMTRASNRPINLGDLIPEEEVGAEVANSKPLMLNLRTLNQVRLKKTEWASSMTGAFSFECFLPCYNR